jgi:hypothetical protein
MQIMIKTAKRKLVPVLIIWMLAASAAAVLTAKSGKDVEVTATISADKIGIDDVLIYTVTFKGINNPEQPDVSHFKDFRMAQTSRSSEFRFINGVSSYYTNFVYYLVPLKTGKLSLPPVTYNYQGREYKTQPFEVEVVKGSVAPPSSSTQRRPRQPFFDEDDFFSPFQRRSRPQEIDVKVVSWVSGKQIRVGEPILFKVLLYTQNRIQSVNMVSDQSLPGFWQEWFPTPRQIEGENKTINGKVYQVYEVRKAALFPTDSGTLTIPSLRFEIGLAGSDPFSVFSNARPIYRSTVPLTLQVSPLPAGAVGLPVGHFRLAVTANKKELDINDILTLNIRVTGTGNIKMFTLPEVKPGEYYKVYPAKISRDFSFQSDSLTGYVEAETPVAFKQTGLISFPPIEFRYFNPETSEAVTLKSQPLMVKVTGHKEKEESAVTIPQTEIIKTGEDIDFIKTGTIYHQEKQLYRNKYFFPVLLLPFLLNLFFLFKIFVVDRFIFQSTLLKQKKLINRTIKSLQHARDQGDIAPILENYLKERTGLGLSEINNQAIAQLLGKYKVSQRDIDTFIQLKTRSESLRFSPEKNSPNRDRDLKNDVKILIRILKEMDSKIK